MPGFPTSTSVTVSDVMATIDAAVGNVAKKYVWLVNIATGVKYGPSAATDSSGNWSLASVDQGIYETFYAGESPAGVVPTQWTTAGVKGYMVSIASNPASALANPLNQQILNMQPTSGSPYIYLDSSKSSDGAAAAPQINLYGYNGRWIGTAMDTSNPPSSRDAVVLGKVGTYSFTDGVTNGTTTVTSPAQGNFTQGQVTKPISGPNILPGTTVASVQSLTSLTMSQAASGSGSGLRITITDDNSVGDALYGFHNGGKAATFGIGVTPPDGSAQLQVGVGSPYDLGRAGLRLLQTAGATGDYLRFVDSGNNIRRWVDTSFAFSGADGQGLTVKADATNARTLVHQKADGSVNYGHVYNGNSLDFRYLTGGVTVWEANTDGSLGIIGKVGFNNTAPITKPTVTGAKGANAALGSLMTALANYGLVVDSTTA